MHISPDDERRISLPFLDASGKDTEGLGRCDTDNNVFFRCPDCNYVLATCGDCFADEDSLSEKFYDTHFRFRKVAPSPNAKKGDCPNCSHEKKGGGALVKMDDHKIPKPEKWEEILTAKGLDSHGKKADTIDPANIDATI